MFVHAPNSRTPQAEVSGSEGSSKSATANLLLGSNLEYKRLCPKTQNRTDKAPLLLEDELVVMFYSNVREFLF